MIAILMLVLSATAADEGLSTTSQLTVFGMGSYTSSWEGVAYGEGPVGRGAPNLALRVGWHEALSERVSVGGVLAVHSHFENLYEGFQPALVPTLSLEVGENTVGTLDAGYVLHLGTATFRGWQMGAGMGQTLVRKAGPDIRFGAGLQVYDIVSNDNVFVGPIPDAAFERASGVRAVGNIGLLW